MFALLANAQGGVWDRLGTLGPPSQSGYIKALQTAPADLATGMGLAILVALGLLYLLQGWKLYKVLVVVNAAALGVLLGWRLGALLRGANAPLFCGIAGGLLCGALAVPGLKYAVSVMGALAGGFLGYGLWCYVARALGQDALTAHGWAGGLIGLVGLGLLALLAGQTVVMIFTAVQGAGMIVTGMLGLLLPREVLPEEHVNLLRGNHHLLPLILAVPAVIGFAVQLAGVAKKAAKKKKAARAG